MNTNPAIGMPYSAPLDRLCSSDEPSFGGKSSRLGELLRAEIPVPPGFAIGTSALEALLTESRLEAVVARALARMRRDDVGSIGDASRAIGDAIRSAPLPSPVRVEIAKRYRELAAQAGEDSPPVAVRSSAVGEDSRDATFAGQQLTRLWVRGADEVCGAVRDCWASLYSPPAISYRAALGDDAPPAIGVTVQLMVDAAVSGVMFTCNPVSGDPSMVAINASWGLGPAVVGGEVTPDDYLVSKVTGEVVREQVNDKQVRCVPHPRGRGTQLAHVPERQREVSCLDPRALAALVALARRIERHFGGHQDIEWAIAHAGEVPDNVFVVQSRPVTGLAKPARAPGAQQSALSLVLGTFGVRAPDEEP